MTRSETYAPEEVARVAGVTRRTVYRWIESGRLPSHKVGPKLWAVYPAVLREFMAGVPQWLLEDMAASLRNNKAVMTTRRQPGAAAAPGAPASAGIPPKQPVATLAPITRNPTKQGKAKKPRR